MTRFAAIFLSFFLLCAASSAIFADPPGRAARLAAIRGEVSFSPAGESDWLHASVNRPITIGDRLWTDRGSRAELQLGGSIIRMGENTSLTLLNLDDDFAQVQVDEGTVSVRTRRLAAGQSVEVATPNLAFETRQTGSYRIQVDPQNDDTTVIVRSGKGEVYGERESFVLDSRQAYRFAGTDLRSYEVIPAPRGDEFERWASERDRQFEGSISARYVSPDVIGYEDLDSYGSWNNDPQYGYVWSPSRVASDWSPYRDGRWAWVEPWGWTWVDDAPWGYAVSHYGRWANTRNRWVWVPAPVRSRAVYAPALVAFVGGIGIQISASGGSTGNVAWFPLGPRDVYRPSYQASRGYFERINRGNTNLSNATITNVYNNTTITNNMYVNRRVRGAVVGVPADAFVHSHPVAKAAVPITPQAAASAPVAAGPSTKPARESVRGSASVATAKPPAHERERRVVARRAPPAAVATAPAPASNTAEPQKGTAPKPPASAATKVIVAAPPQSAPPSATPPAKAPEGRPSDRKGGDRQDRQARRSDDGKMSTPATAPATPAPPAATPPAAATQPAAPKAQAEAPPARSGGVSEKRDGDKRASEKAAADKVAAEKAAAETAAGEKRDADRRAAEKAAAERAGADKAAAEKAAAERAVGEKRDADRRAAEKAAADRAAAERAASQKAAAERAAGEKRDADRRSAEKAAADRAAAQRAAGEKAAAERAAGEKRDADRRAAEKAAADRAAAERRDAEKRAAEKAAAERSAAEKRIADNRAAEKRSAEKQAAEKHAAEKQAEKGEGDAKK